MGGREGRGRRVGSRAGEGVLHQERHGETLASVSHHREATASDPLRRLLRAQPSGLPLALQLEGANNFLLLQDPEPFTLGSFY